MGSVFGPIRFLLPACRLCWFLYTLNILYMPIYSRIFLSNYWWQKSDIWSQALYKYPISWEACFDPSDSYFLFAEERRYHSSSCCIWCILYFKFNGIDSINIVTKLGNYLVKGHRLYSGTWNKRIGLSSFRSFRETPTWSWLNTKSDFFLP